VSPGSKRIFTGTAGVYYFMYQLAASGFHASCTHGNAPYLDILVSSEDGDRSLAIQVKATEYALRHRGRGEARQPHHLEFPLGHKAAKLSRPGVLFAFVDLAAGPSGGPTVYLVPSAEVSRFCAPWVDSVPMVRFHPSVEWLAPYREAWALVAAAVGEPPEVPAPAEGVAPDAEPLYGLSDLNKNNDSVPPV
jgi:hypothetical protein